jgi:hypothetical protein
MDASVKEFVRFLRDGIGNYGLFMAVLNRGVLDSRQQITAQSTAITAQSLK